jgi:hypothetical protein
MTLTTAVVDRGFFDVLRIPTIEGRLPEESDGRDGTTPVVMSAAAVRLVFPETGVERRAESGPLRVQVTGVVGDVRMRSIGDPSPRVLFLPLDHMNQMPSFILVRTSAPHEASMERLRDALTTLGADVITIRVESLAQAMSGALGDTGLAADAAVPLAVLATLLAGAGLYGVSARRALDRRREFAIRMALGATAATVSREVIADSMRRILPGIAAGVLLALMVAAAMRALLFGIGWADPVTLAGAVLLIAITSMTAATVPARRAARVQPHTALRGD